MAHVLFDSRAHAATLAPELPADPDQLGHVLGPMMAGARARGMADAFDMLGVAGILLDRAGRVLHANGRAERALRPLVRLIGNHLVGCDSDVNERLQHVMMSALGEKPHEEDVDFIDADGVTRFTIKSMRLPQDGAPAVQLLRAVLVITEAVA